MSTAWRITAKSASLAVLAASVAYLQIRFHIFGYLSPERIDALLSKAGVWAPVLQVVLMAAAIVISPIPSTPLTAAGGVVFGPFWGTVLSLTGALSGAVLAFLIARHLGREVLERILRRPLSFYPRGSQRILTRIVLVSRLIPVVSFDVVSYGAGLTDMSLAAFALVTLVGMTPLTVLFTVLGWTLFIKPWIAVTGGAVFLAFFLAFPWLVRTYNLFGLRTFTESAQDDDAHRDR